MGLIKGIADAVLQKAKNEMKDYILKVMEEEGTEKETDEALNNEGPEKEETEETSLKEEPDEIEEEDEEEADDEEILPLVEENIIRLTFKTRPEEVAVPKDIVEVLQFLSLNEFAVYLKLFIFCCDQKKNYGYLGNTLRKKTGLGEMDPGVFDKTVNRLNGYGLIQVEEVSDNQRTFVLYIPFDEEKNTKVDASEKKPEKKHSPNRDNRNNDRRPQKNFQKNKPEKNDKPKKEVNHTEKPLTNELPGIAVAGNENEDLYKSYRTYVSLEIDKAKMRVGRSNFDKIYMEAVKYIDKNFGFKVLSDSEKFKEYLTSYYISAFDIKTFEEWKKHKP
jgi:hypothetical protein